MRVLLIKAMVTSKYSLYLRWC